MSFFLRTTFLLLIVAVIANQQNVHICVVADHAHADVEITSNDHNDTEVGQGQHGHIHRHDENSPYHEHEHGHGHTESKFFPSSSSIKISTLTLPKKVIFSHSVHFSDVTLPDDVRPPIFS